METSYWIPNLSLCFAVISPTIIPSWLLVFYLIFFYRNTKKSYRWDFLLEGILCGKQILRGLISKITFGGFLKLLPHRWIELSAMVGYNITDFNGRWITYSHFNDWRGVKCKWELGLRLGIGFSSSHIIPFVYTNKQVWAGSLAWAWAHTES